MFWVVLCFFLPLYCHAYDALAYDLCIHCATSILLLILISFFLCSCFNHDFTLPPDDDEFQGYDYI